MKKGWILFVLLSILSIPILSHAQTEYVWRFTNPPGGVSGTGNTVFVNVSSAGASFSSLAWTISGGPASCTVQIDFSNDGTTVAGQTVAAQTCTSNGSFTAAGSATPPFVRVSFVIAANGVLTFTAKGCKNSTCTSGGGSGTVTNTGGALTANSIVLGAGGNDTKVATGIVTTGTNNSELDLGVSGTSGVLGLNGSTSGKATCTAPAVAGTVTNAVTCSNNFLFNGIQIGNGTLAAGVPGIAGNTSANVNFFDWGGQSAIFYNGALVETTGNHLFHPLGTNRNLLFVTANFTTAANTSLQTITGLAFTAPASAVNLNFHCALAYSQATATAAVAFGIQAATNAPTNIFAVGNQQITVGPPATYVSGALPTLTTTTATNIVSGTPGTIATNYVVYLDGTMELAANANTVNFMVSTATSGDAVTVLRGSYCMIF